MSRPDDNFLSRWSRRKQAVKEAETAAPEEPVEELVPEAAAEGSGAHRTPVLEEPAAAEAAEPLPPIEDLTADSDISAFLRKGVPDALKQAALRKIWALDPAIRDHIGPADYAWDYNDPGSIPGFGGSTKSAAVEKVASLITGGEPSAPVPPEPRATKIPPTESVRLSSSAVEPVPHADTPSGGDPAPSPSPQGGGEPQIADVSGGGGPAPRHGGAMPR